MKIRVFINNLLNAFYMAFSLLITKTLFKARFGHIGSKSILFGSFVSLLCPDRIFIGNGVRILKFARLDCIKSWMGLNFEPNLIIGNNVNIGQNFFISCASKILINDGVLISDNVAIIDNDHEYKVGVSLSKTPICTNEIIIEKNVTIYRGVTILRGSYIEEGAIIGANAIVKGRVFKNTMVAGMPSKQIKNLS
jgi:acetyltransferase-like isoleucine patch superfamily enzyme